MLSSNISGVFSTQGDTLAQAIGLNKISFEPGDKKLASPANVTLWFVAGRLAPTNAETLSDIMGSALPASHSTVSAEPGFKTISFLPAHNRMGASTARNVFTTLHDLGGVTGETLKAAGERFGFDMPNRDSLQGLHRGTSMLHLDRR